MLLYHACAVSFHSFPLLDIRSKNTHPRRCFCSTDRTSRLPLSSLAVASAAAQSTCNVCSRHACAVACQRLLSAPAQKLMAGAPRLTGARDALSARVYPGRVMERAPRMQLAPKVERFW